MARFIYFNGTAPVASPQSIDAKEFAALFPGVTGCRYDSFHMWVGRETMQPGARLVPVTRIIQRKSNPSLHKCDARCRNATGRTCECACGGQYHGAGG